MIYVDVDSYKWYTYVYLQKYIYFNYLYTIKMQVYVF